MLEQHLSNKGSVDVPKDVIFQIYKLQNLHHTSRKPVQQVLASMTKELEQFLSTK